MNKKLLWTIIILGILIVTLVGLKKAGVLGKDEGTKVSAEKAQTRTIIETVNASGKVYPEIEVKVSPDISGEITELTVQEGDSVRKGQVLARIYADIYNSQRDQAAAMVNQQIAGVDNSQAQLAGLKANLDQTRAAYNRQKTLHEQKVISRSEFETAESAFRSAEANYNAAQQGIRSNQASVTSAKAALERANKDVSRATITAPMDGVVSLLAVKKGERVVGTAQMAGTEMMRIADMNVIEVQVDVSENDIPKVNLGDSAIVEIDAYNNRKFKGLVTQIASSTTSATSAATTNDVTNYKVHIRLLPETYKDLYAAGKPKRFPFRPGMSASADIQTKRIDNVLSVPVNAVTTREKGSDKPLSQKKNTDQSANNEQDQEKAGGTTPDNDLDEVVYVLQADKTVKKVLVKTGIQDITYIQITSGLKAGDEVITGPYSTVSKTLKDGLKVNVVPKDKLFETKK